MATDTTLRRLRWAAPVAAGAVVAAVAYLPGAVGAFGSPDLPARSARQLVADVLSLPSPHLTGTVVETPRLGLPEVPTTGREAAALSWPNLLTGTHTAKVWLDGPARQRIALMGDLAESDVVHAGSDLWVYSSATSTATHTTLGPAARHEDLGGSGAVPVTPTAAADRLLGHLAPTTSVTVDQTRVAGRDAYELVLTPRDPRTLVTRVTVALDGQTRTPLRVRVYGADHSTPAFETGFTAVSFGTPDASVFRFRPPAGARVTRGSVAGGGLAAAGVALGGPAPSRVVGSGWSAVAVVDDPFLFAFGRGAAARNQRQLLDLVQQSATRVPEGRLLSTALFSVLLTDDGRLYVGAVGPTVLRKVVSTGTVP